MALRDLDIQVDLEVNSNGLAQANAQIDQLINKIKKIDDDITIKIDVDAFDAMVEISRLEAKLATIRNHTVDIDVDSGAAMAQILALQAMLAQLNGGGPLPPFPNGGGGSFGGGASTPFGAMLGMATKGLAAAMAIESIPVLIGTLGTVGYAVGALTNGVLALGSAIGSAGLGMGAFGLVAFTSISKLYDENAKLTQSQKELKTHIDSLSYSYSVMEKSAQPLVYDTIGKGVNTIKTAIHNMTPIVDDAAIAIGGLFHDLNRSLQGERMTEFFDYIERSTGPMINNIGTGLGYALQGVANTMVALEPLTNWMAQGFENLFKKFADWSFLQKDSVGFTSFIDNTKDALSAIGDIAGGAFTGIKNFFGAFEFTAVDGLEWLGDKMQDFAKWSSDLDNNQGFQDMLAQIAHDGPIIADTIGNIADAVERLYDVYNGFSDSLLGEDGIFGWINDKMDPSKAFEGFTLENVFKPGGALNAVFPDLDWSAMLGLDKLGDTISNLDIGGWLSTAASNAGEWWGGITDGIASAFNSAVESMASGLSGLFSDLSFDFDLGGTINSALASFDIPPINWNEFISSVNWGEHITSINWLGILNPLNWGEYIVSLDWGGIVTSVNWSSFINMLPWGSFVTSFSWSSFISNLSWSSFVKALSWGGFVSNLSWSSFVRSLSWSSFIKSVNLADFVPKFSWPSVGGVAGGIGRTIASKMGFDTGIGRVPEDLHGVTIHKDEAVLQPHNAQALRDAGILQGEGRHPRIDLSARNVDSTTNAAPTRTLAAPTSNSNSVHIDVGGISVTVQGGTTNEETGNIVTRAVQRALQDSYANVIDVMAMTREG